MKFMIKLIAILSVFAGSFTNLTAQIAYYDALELSKLTSKYKVNSEQKIEFTLSTDDSNILERLKLYFKDESSYNQNPFIKITATPSYKVSTSTKITPSTVKGIIDTRTVVEGIAKFLVGRVKEELSAAFFKRFKDEITKDKYKIYKNLFPETFKMLETIDEEIYKFSSYIQVLRESFEKDLNNAYENLPTAFNRLMEDDKIKKFFADKPWLEVIFNFGFYIIDSLKKEKHPGDILAGLETDILILDDHEKDKLVACKLQNLRNAIKLLKIISYSLRKESDDRYWIDKDDLKKLFERDNNGYVAFKIYLGLIYQQSKDIQFKVKINNAEKTIYFSEILTTLKKPITEIEDVNIKIEGFMYRVGQLEIFLKDIKKMIQEDKKPTYNDYFKFYNATLDTMEYSLDFFEYFLDKGMPANNITAEEYSKGKIVAISEVKKYLGVARAVGDIYMNVKNRNFSSIIFNVIKIFDNVIAPAFGEDSKDIRAGILKYGSFLAAVANAQNSDEVKEAITAVVLPVGSSSIKRNSKFNISLNAYVGPSVFKGDESDGKEFLGFNKARVWAPIGMALSFGKINIPVIKYAIKSFTLFASIIDIGAVTAFRFKPENAEEIPKFTLKNIVSPGLHVMINIKSAPISFGGGVQRLPQLEMITKDGQNIITDDKIWRFNLFIAVDIPLLNFMTR